MKKRIKKVVSVALATALVSACFTACGSNSASSSKSDSSSNVTSTATSTPSGTGTTVKIGSLWPLTGTAASIGQQHADGAEMAIKEINANGGIKSMNGAKIELVGADTASEADTASTECERLITEENCSLIIGAYNSTCCISSSEVAQKYKIPYLSMGGVATAITERGYDYVFRVNNTATYDVAEMINGLSDVTKGTEYKDIKYALIYENSDWGSDNAKIWKELADKKGWKCVLDEPVTSGQSDMTSQVLKIKESGADVVNVSFYTDDSIVFQNAMYANNVIPDLGVWSVGGGYQDSAFFESVGQDVYNHVFVQEDWDVSGVQNHDWIKKVAQQCEDTYGYKMSSFFAQGWTDAYIAYYALEAAGTTDPEKLRDAIKGLDVKNSDNERALLTGYTAVKFDEKGQNTFEGGATGGTIVQYVDGEERAVSPEAHTVKGVKAEIPIPGATIGSYLDS